MGVPETNIFQTLFTHLFLTKNMRQKGDQTWLEILNRMRIGQMTDDDFEIVESRLNVDFDEEPYKSAIRLFPTNPQCNEYNTMRLNKLHDETGETIETLQARNWSPRSSDEEFLKQFLPTSDTHTNGIPNELTLVIGAPVMLLRNICQSRGMCNGSRGTVHSFSYDDHDCIDTVNVLFDDPNVGQVLNNMTEAEKEPVPIKKTTIFFLGKHNIEIYRHQFPLKLCFASTYHKIQGANLDAAVIDAGSKVFQAQMAYVAFSRVRELKNIGLTAFSRRSIYIDENVANFYKSLDAPWKDSYKKDQPGDDDKSKSSENGTDSGDESSSSSNSEDNKESSENISSDEESSSSSDSAIAHRTRNKRK